jgi:hypothetical protein
VKPLQFGVYCFDCLAAELVEIPGDWIALEPAQAIFLLSQSQDDAASEIVDFFEVHEAHGAVPVILYMEELFYERKEP